MALVKIAPDNTLISASIELRALSGTVLVSQAPAARRVILYKNREINSYASVISNASDGSWSFSVVANDNDRFRVIIVGDPDSGEHSRIFYDVVAG